MIQIKSFTFNPFQENTIVLFDQSNDCVIIDPGCYDKEEETVLSDFIDSNNLKPVRLLNTHCHIDHVLGNGFISRKYGLDLEIHQADLPLLEAVENQGKMFGVRVNPSPAPKAYLKEGDTIRFGNSELEVIFVPGHAPGHVAFVSKDQSFVISGDVIFKGSIGRTDLPGGNYDTLIESIEKKILPLGENFEIFPGHGPSTTVKEEIATNPFLN